MKRIILVFIVAIFLNGCSNSENNQTSNNEEDSNAFQSELLKAEQLDKVSEIHVQDEKYLYSVIRNNYMDKNYLDLQLKAESFYKKFKMSEKLDSVEIMYEEALDSLEAQELREEGNLAFKRYKLHENPILNPNPAASAPVDAFLTRFVGRSSDFANLVKNQLQNPSSFEYIETKYLNKKSGYIALILRFKAKNGLGMVVEKVALGKFDKISETFHDIKIKD